MHTDGSAELRSLPPVICKEAAWAFNIIQSNDPDQFKGALVTRVVSATTVEQGDPAWCGAVSNTIGAAELSAGTKALIWLA